MALSGANMTRAVTHLKRMRANAKSEGFEDVAVSINLRLDAVEWVVLLCWNSLLVTSIDKVCDYLKLLRAYLNPDRIPNENIAQIAARRALEFAPPRNKVWDPKKFFLVIDVWKPEQPTNDLTFAAPLWCEYVVGTGENTSMSAAVFELSVQDGIFIPLMKLRGAAKDVLLEVAQDIFRRIQSYPPETKLHLKRLIAQLSTLFVLIGPEPFFEGASISSLETTLKLKDCRFERQLNGNDYYKALVAASWSLHVTESEVWPIIEPILRSLQESNDSAMVNLKKCTDNWSSWKNLLRKSALDKIEIAGTKYIIGKLEGVQYLESEASVTCEENKAFIEVLNLISCCWPNKSLQEAKALTNEFNKKILGEGMKATLFKMFDCIVHPVEQDALALLQTMSQDFPIADGFKVRVSSADDFAKLQDVSLILLRNIGQHFPLVSALSEVAEKLSSRLAVDAAGETGASWASLCSSFATFRTWCTLKAIWDTYMASGSTTEERVTKDKTQANMKALIAANVAVTWPMTCAAKEFIVENEFAFSNLHALGNSQWIWHGTAVVNKYQLVLKGKMDVLLPIMGGSMDGKIWSKHVGPDTK